MEDKQVRASTHLFFPHGYHPESIVLEGIAGGITAEERAEGKGISISRVRLAPPQTEGARQTIPPIFSGFFDRTRQLYGRKEMRR